MVDRETVSFVRLKYPKKYEHFSFKKFFLVYFFLIHQKFLMSQLQLTSHLENHMLDLQLRDLKKQLKLLIF